jgi:hypothetical protein
MAIKPSLLSEWDFASNGGLDPAKIAQQSNKVVWWKCLYGHSWQKKIQSRFLYDSGCPSCKSLGFLHPLLAEEVDSRNNAIDVMTLSAGSSTKIWWACKTNPEHSWEASPYSRLHGYKGRIAGCPFCSSRTVHISNSLATLKPDIAAQWDSIKNGDLTPSDVTAGSHTKAWWICVKGHSFSSVVKDRTQRGAGCGLCSRQTSKAELRLISELEQVFGTLEMRSKYRGIWLDVFIKELRIGIEYDGVFYHSKRYEQDENKRLKLLEHGVEIFRLRETGLALLTSNDIETDPAGLTKGSIDKLLACMAPKIPQTYYSKLQEYLGAQGFMNEAAYRKRLADIDFAPSEKSLSAAFPDLLLDWDFDENLINPKTAFPFSREKVWWKCRVCAHRWLAAIGNRSSGNGCPNCSNKIVTETYNLAVLHPDLMEEWDYEANGILPQEVFPQSNYKYQWVCRTDSRHRWQAPPVSRTYKNTGCPFCSGSVVHETTCLAVTRPDLLQIWDFAKNETLPEEVTAGSGERVHWKCSDGHEWQSAVFSVASGSGCGICAGVKFNPDRSLAKIYPEVAKCFSSKNEVTSNDVGVRSHGEKFLWMCDHKHEWSGTVREQVNKFLSSRPGLCVFCRTIGHLIPSLSELVIETHKEKLELTSGSNKEITLLCECGSFNSLKIKVMIKNLKKHDLNCIACREILLFKQES